jgi:hypothetical protein
MTGITRVSSPTLARPGARTRIVGRRLSLAGLGLPTVGALVFAFLYLPILVLVIFSFNSGAKMGIWEGFSFRWYESVFQNRQIGQSLEVTLWVSFMSMIISTFLGTIAALAMERHRFPGKLTVDGVLYLPVIIPDIVMALSLLLFFSSVNIPLSRYSILIGHVAFNTSFVAVIVRARLAVLDPRLEEAAADLQAGHPGGRYNGVHPVVRRVCDHIVHERPGRYDTTCAHMVDVALRSETRSERDCRTHSIGIQCAGCAFATHAAKGG